MLFNELEAAYYERLKSEGFVDIEDTSNPDRPLKRFHSFDLVSEETQIRKIKRSPYQTKIDSFANDPAFSEIVTLMVKHGNSLFTAQGIEQIWDLHRRGTAERQIASQLGCSKSCIHFILQRMKQWMNLL